MLDDGDGTTSVMAPSLARVSVLGCWVRWWLAR